MAESLVLATLIIAICIIFLSIRLFMGKKRFINMHIDGNKALNRKGIHCAQSQDAQMRKKKRISIKEKSEKQSNKNT